MERTRFRVRERHASPLTGNWCRQSEMCMVKVGRSVPDVHGAGAGSLSRGLVLAPFQYARFVDEFLFVHGEAGHVGGVSDLEFGLV